MIVLVRNPVASTMSALRRFRSKFKPSGVGNTIEYFWLMARVTANALAVLDSQIRMVNPDHVLMLPHELFKRNATTFLPILSQFLSLTPREHCRLSRRLVSLEAAQKSVNNIDSNSGPASTWARLNYYNKTGTEFDSLEVCIKSSNKGRKCTDLVYRLLSTFFYGKIGWNRGSRRSGWPLFTPQDNLAPW